jgi:hypothetical protein
MKIKTNIPNPESHKCHLNNIITSNVELGVDQPLQNAKMGVEKRQTRAGPLVIDGKASWRLKVKAERVRMKANSK